MFFCLLSSIAGGTIESYQDTQRAFSNFNRLHHRILLQGGYRSGWQTCDNALAKKQHKYVGQLTWCNKGCFCWGWQGLHCDEKDGKYI